MPNLAGAQLATRLAYLALCSFGRFAADASTVTDVGTNVLRAILIAALILLMLN